MAGRCQERTDATADVRAGGTNGETEEEMKDAKTVASEQARLITVVPTTLRM